MSLENLHTWRHFFHMPTDRATNVEVQTRHPDLLSSHSAKRTWFEKGSFLHGRFSFFIARCALSYRCIAELTSTYGYLCGWTIIPTYILLLSFVFNTLLPLRRYSVWFHTCLVSHNIRDSGRLGQRDTRVYQTICFYHVPIHSVADFVYRIGCCCGG